MMMDMRGRRTSAKGDRLGFLGGLNAATIPRKYEGRREQEAVQVC